MGNIRNIIEPKTIAVIGATERENSPGFIILKNLLKSKNRKIIPVNPKRKEIFGLSCVKKISDVKEHVDLAVITTSFDTILKLIEECGKSSVDGAIIISSYDYGEKEKGRLIENQLKEISKRYGIRIIGPNCLGIIRPVTDYNASIFNTMPEKGGVAFISQSLGMSRAFLNWGIEANIGFSMFASLGSMVDIDFGEMIDFLGEDVYTRSIVMYMEETVGNVKRFVSAARGFARNKPIIVLKPRREEEKPGNPSTYTASMLDRDKIYDAVFKRLGILRVKDARDLFNLATVLHGRKLPLGPRLLILTNTPGSGLMALNALKDQGGEPASISHETYIRLNETLGPWVQQGFFIDLLRDADELRYKNALEVCLKEKNADGILIIYTPQDVMTSENFAKTLVASLKNPSKPVIVCFFGGEKKEIKDVLTKSNIPAYDTPEEAVKTYLYMYKYERYLRSLYETPRDLSLDEIPPTYNLKLFIRKSLKNGISVLTDDESQKFLECFGIPTLRTYVARSVDEAIMYSREIGFPLVIKVASPDIIHRADFGGVITGITSESELRVSYEKLLARAKEVHPDARIKGVALQKMLEKIDYEVLLGVKKDEEFGSIILFGMSGVGLRIFKDFSIGLPPLNQTLAKRLMEDTHVYRMLHGYGEKPPADIQQLEAIIVSYSNLVSQFPEIQEMDVNPIAISDGKIYALDARIVLDKNILNENYTNTHLVITPYPTRYVVQTTLKDGRRAILRPIRPEDEPLEREMLSSLSEETLRSRFFTVLKDISHDMLIKFCHIDYDREMAIVAEIFDNGKRRIIGIGRLIIDSDFEKGECAVVVHDEFQRQGLGLRLMDMLLVIGEEKKLKEVYAYVMSTNKKMLNLAKKMGFTIEPLQDNLCLIKVELT
ncbi:MAG: bifunctional acetate--CoA ligase family protein/GNAT family N-acetyltransferase [Deltaproteobacteria bacterium]|nr:bifunctional acetate--CoA ligase family protein/GNAT family N-acetyltransferase [Deltaproteobacteria bacterium]